MVSRWASVVRESDEVMDCTFYSFSQICAPPRAFSLAHSPPVTIAPGSETRCDSFKYFFTLMSK